MNQPVSPDSPALIQIISSLMPQWSPESVIVEAHLPGGYAHANYRVRYGEFRFVLRTPSVTPDRDELAFESRWLTSLPPDIGAPTMAFDATTGALLSAWIDAPLLAHTPATPPELVTYLVALHRRLPAAKRRYDLTSRVGKWLAGARLQGRAGRVVKRARERAAAHQPGNDWPLQTTHNDLNPLNILCAADGWRTLDWEWVGDNDPLFDLVALGLGVQVDHSTLAEMARDYVEQTGQAQRLVSDRLEHTTCAYWLREYAWAEHELCSGNDRLEVEAQRNDALSMLSRL